MGSRLHQTLQRMDPGFSFRTLGHSTLTKYLEASPEVKVTRPRGAGDVTVELVDQPSSEVRGARPRGATSEAVEPANQATPTETEEPADAEQWARIDDIWQVRAGEPGGRIPGQRAASDAAQALGVQNLKGSPYKTLQRLLDSSEYLSARWSREGNNIIKR